MQWKYIIYNNIKQNDENYKIQPARAAMYHELAKNW